MESISCKEEKFINEGGQEEVLFLILERNAKAFNHFVFFIFVTRVAKDITIKSNIKKFDF